MGRHDQRGVERRPGHRHGLVDDAHAVETLRSRCKPITANTHDEGTRLPDRLLAHQVSVTHDGVKT